MAAARGLMLGGLIADLDAGRDGRSLASMCRLEALAFASKRTAPPSDAGRLTTDGSRQLGGEECTIGPAPDLHRQDEDKS